MDAVEVEIVRREVEALAGELAQERWRHVAGLEGEPSLERIFRAHSRAAHRDTVAALRASGQQELAARAAELRVERAAATEEEAWRAAEARAVVHGPDGNQPLGTAEIAILGERRRDRRLALGQAVAEAVSRVAAPREAAAEARARARAEMGLAPDWELVVEADDLLAASDDAYEDVLAWLARREVGLRPGPAGDLERADLLHLISLPGQARWFLGGMLPVVLRGALERLGLDIGRIRIEETDRPAQRPGAHALGRRVSWRRQGGAADYLGLFRAAGSALADALHPAPGDPVFASAFGWLVSGLLLEPLFLGRELRVERTRAPDLVRALALRGLFTLRTSAAALRVAAEVERGSSGASWRAAHREALSGAALAAWPDGLAARDSDGAAHRAFLLGAAWAARIQRDLRQRLDEDWWRNPRAAAVLGGLLAAGRAGEEKQRPPLAEAAGALVGQLSSGG